VTNRLLVLATALLLTTVTLAQQNSRSGAVREQANADKAVQLRGRFEKSGARFFSDDGGRFVVRNPDLLAREDGHMVTVKCVLSSDQDSIQVLSVRTSEAKYVTAYGDSAFRR